MSAGVPAEVTAAGELWAGVLVQLSSVTSTCLLFVVVVAAFVIRRTTAMTTL